jgi:DNA polymerase III delta prime subunit
MFAEKYCPKNLKEILSSENELYTLVKNFKTSRFFNFLIYGSNGTGKSLFCKIQKKNLLIHNPGGNFLFIDVLQETNIGDIKKKIRNFIESKFSIEESYKIIIIENVDHLLSSAQLYLRENLEKGDRGLSFWLLSNSLVKINPTILSRCLVVNFKHYSSTNFFVRANEIHMKESIDFYYESIIDSLIFCVGDTRRALNFCYQKSILTRNSFFPSITHKKLFSAFLSKKIKESMQKESPNVFLLKMETIQKKRIMSMSEIAEKIYLSSIYTTILRFFQKAFFSLNISKNSLTENFFFFIYFSRKKFCFRNKKCFK